jgi:WS/DGAT/MGAT family acyltransferase
MSQQSDDSAADRPEHLSSIDTAWYRMDTETNQAYIGGILIFDQPVDFERLERLIEERLVGLFPRFRQKVVESTGRMARPHWQEDEKFELGTHLHHLALPEPGDKAVLQETAGELMTQALDDDRPLWQIYLLDNYEGGSALLVKLHHCLGDGFALARVLLSMADEGYGLEAPDDAEQTESHRSLGSRVRGELEERLMEPEGRRKLIREIGDVAAELGHIVLMPFDPKTRLKNRLKGNVRVAWSESLSLSQLKEIAHGLDATVNDVLMAGVTGALRNYLAEADEPVDTISVRAIVPVNLRPARSIEEMEAVLGNEFGLVFLELPIFADGVDERLREVKQNIDALKESPEAVVAFGILTAEGAASAPVEHLVNDIFARKASLVVSNVPGPKKPLRIAGRELEDLMFWVPHPTDFGLGISLISYNGRVNIGVRADTAICEDPQALVDGIVEEFESLRDS